MFESMKLRSFKQRLIFQIVLIVLVLAVFITFLLLFRANINHQLSIIEDIKSEIFQSSNSVENLSMLIGDWKVVKDYRDAIGSLVPHKDDFVSLPKDIEVMANANNVSTSFSFESEDPSSKNKELKSIGFTLNIRGESNDVISFLEKIENKYHSINISILDYSFDRANGNAKIFAKGILFYVDY